MESAVLLRQAMEALDITGVALAAELTRMRDDGKETGTATISRWLHGASPVEPAVLCWLRELVRMRARHSARTTISWGAKKSLTIAVSSNKGGVGVSTIATALSVLVQKELHVSSRFVRVGCREDLFTRLLPSLHVSIQHVGVNELSTCAAAEGEIVIVEISKYAAYEVIDKAAFSALPIDIILVPADFSSATDMWGTRDFLDTVQTNALVTLLHYAREISMDLATIAATEGFDVTSDQFVRFAFPFLAGQAMLPSRPGGEWSNPQQFDLFYRLLENLLERVGLEIADRETSQRQIDAMELPQLLAVVAR